MGIISIWYLGCGGNFHKRCAFKIPNNCTGDNAPKYGSLQQRSVSQQWSVASGESVISNASNSSFMSTGSFKERRATWSGNSGRPAELDRLVNKLEIPHTFVVHSYKRPTVCHVCRKLVRDFFTLVVNFFFCLVSKRNSW